MRRALLPSSLPLLLSSLLGLSSLAGCAAQPAQGPAEDDPQQGTEGELFDERTDMPADWSLKADWPAPYEVPEDLPELVEPEVIVSLDGLTVHLFDRVTGFSRVYPAGVGVLGQRSGRSITPTGHFETHADTGNGWWYVATRWEPAYFEGYPFLRITARNSRGWATYGLHGPITDPLRRGYVSHGCIRMAHEDIVELFFLVKDHASTPVTIQDEVERDAAGRIVDLGTDPELWAPDEPIAYGASVGPRVGFVGQPCETDADCAGHPATSGAYCHPAGFCTQPCDGYCPDAAGEPTTFCVQDPTTAAEDGICVSKVDPRNASCATVSGTVPATAERYLGAPGVVPAEAEVCLPVP